MVDNVIDMSMMFQRAASFSSNLYPWGDRLVKQGVTVDVYEMFLDSACPVDDSPEELGTGPWCYALSDSSQS